MYNDHLEERNIPIDGIFLDPNNPRFWTERTTRELPDKKIPESETQARAQEAINRHGVEELYNSILRNGFLPLDRIVVRPIKEIPDKYVVVEGNRRLAALKMLRRRVEEDSIDEKGISEEYLSRLKSETDSIEVLVYTGGETSDIAWLLQGIRHISGIRDWAPAQRARLVAQQIDEKEIGYSEAGQQFGLSAQAVGRLYRSYKALEQMRQDEEYQSRARNDYFSLFEEAIRNKDVKTWLGWDEEKSIFTRTENLRQFYSWITPDEANDNSRRIHDPRQVKHLGYLVAGKHDNLITLIDQHTITIDGAYDRAVEVGRKHDWTEAIDRAIQLIADIPQSAIQAESSRMLERLTELDKCIASLRKMAEAVKGG